MRAVLTVHIGAESAPGAVLAGMLRRVADTMDVPEHIGIETESWRYGHGKLSAELVITPEGK